MYVCRWRHTASTSLRTNTEPPTTGRKLRVTGQTINIGNKLRLYRITLKRPGKKQWEETSTLLLQELFPMELKPFGSSTIANPREEKGRESKRWRERALSRNAKFAAFRAFPVPVMMKALWLRLHWLHSFALAPPGSEFPKVFHSIGFDRGTSRFVGPFVHRKPQLDSVRYD